MASGQMGNGPFKSPFTTVLVLSVVFHVFVLVIIPIATKLVWKPSKFRGQNISTGKRSTSIASYSCAANTG